MFQIDQVYKRRDLHEKYGGQQQGGISTPANHPFIFLFSSKSGKNYGYEDGWNANGHYLYTGEGQEGDMQFVRGNKAIRDHQKDGKSLYLFEYVDRGYVRFIGEMVCWKIHEKSGLDIKGRLRKMIVFELIPAN